VHLKLSTTIAIRKMPI